MMVDNAGAVVSVPVGDIFKSSTTASTTTKIVSSASSSTTNVVNNTTETTIPLSLNADSSYVPIVNSSKDNLINSIVYQSNGKWGFGTKIQNTPLI